MSSPERILSSPSLSPVSSPDLSPSPVPRTEKARSAPQLSLFDTYKPAGVVFQDISDASKKMCANMDEKNDTERLLEELWIEIEIEKKVLKKSQETGKECDEMKQSVTEKEMKKMELKKKIGEHIAEHERLTKLMSDAIDRINFVPVRGESSVVPADQQPSSSSSSG